jgi:RNA 3'-terminal phosphate cyclase
MQVVRALRPIDWTDAGLVKRVRGVAYSTKVSPQVANRAVHAARAVLNHLLPDVYVFTDVYRCILHWVVRESVCERERLGAPAVLRRGLFALNERYFTQD